MELKGPIVIGGIGGSGTRVVAQILNELNIYIGNDLNGPLDNLSYTLLFKRRKWFYRNIENRKEIYKGLGILEKSMKNHNPRFTVSENIFINKATLSMYINGHNKEGRGKGKWAIERLKIIRKGKTEITGNEIGWGWKEPNSHLILKYLNEFFPDLKYIHVIRNGLDIAYSSNQQQLYNWGAIFEVDLPKSDEEIPISSFRYWILANKQAFLTGAAMGAKRFHVVNFDKLICHDENEILGLLSFLGFEYSQHNIDSINGLIKKPITVQRYLEHNYSWLSKNDRSELMNLGFSVK